MKLPLARRAVSYGIVLLAVAGVGLLLVLLLALLSPGDTASQADRHAKTSAIEPTSSSTAENRPAAESNDVDDDGQTLWVSPTAGSPLALDYLPPATQMLLALRPAETIKLPEGQKLLAVLQARIPGLQEFCRDVVGIEPAEMESLQIAWFADGHETAQWALVVRPAVQIELPALLDAWKHPQPTRHGTAEFYAGPRCCYYLPKNSTSQTILLASRETVIQLIDLAGAAPLRNELALLARSSDGSRHFNLLAVPRDLISEEPGAWVADLGALRSALAWFFADDLQAILLSGQLSPEFFLELRAMGSVGSDPAQLARKLALRLKQAGPTLAGNLAGQEAEFDGSPLIERLPAMLDALNRYTRSGAEGRAALLRAYLPAPAAHNFALAASLLRGEPGPSASTSDREPARGRTAAAALAQQATLSFPRETLERALELLGAQIDCPITILGTDLQREGITRNQMFSLEATDSAGNVLRQVLSAANPAGKLTFVIRRTDDGREGIFITTHSSAAQRGEADGQNLP